MGKSVAIIQSNYIPWKGYFDIVAQADEFILYDDVQYTRSDWRNRNLIKTPQGLRWLTIPVKLKGRFGQRICDTETSGDAWRRSHWASIRQNYARAPFFRRYAERFEAAYLSATDAKLSAVNRSFIELVCELLGIGTRITWCMQYAIGTDRQERLIELCRLVGGDRYLSGPAARAYLDPAAFERAGIELAYMDYSGYPTYPQQHGEFAHGVTVLDLLFNTGDDARRHLKAFAKPC
jgi:hypothetical protein